jgi:hypothetical protein
MFFKRPTTGVPRRGSSMTSAIEKGRRGRRFRVDPRFIIGVALVGASIAGVWAIVSAVDDSREVFSARSTLTAGDRITSDDLLVSHVRLGAGESHYLSPATLPDDGLVVTRTVLEGELVPVSAIATDAAGELARVVVPVGDTLSAQVVAGASVDLWSAREVERGRWEPPAVLVGGAEVAEVLEAGSLFAGTPGRSVELLVPREKTAAVLEALAAGDAMTLVPSVAAAGE